MLKQIIMHLPIFGTILSVIVNGFFLLLGKYYHQKQKNELDKAIEHYKHQLQVEFLKTEIKTRQLFSIYPQIFAKIKRAEGDLFILYGPVKKRRQIEQKDLDDAWRTCVEARSYVNVNLIFISEDVKKLASQIFDTMEKFNKNNMSENEILETFDLISTKCNLLATQMKKEIASESQQ